MLRRDQYMAVLGRDEGKFPGKSLAESLRLLVCPDLDNPPEDILLGTLSIRSERICHTCNGPLGNERHNAIPPRHLQNLEEIKAAIDLGSPFDLLRYLVGRYPDGRELGGTYLLLKYRFPTKLAILSKRIGATNLRYPQPDVETSHEFLQIFRRELSAAIQLFPQQDGAAKQIHPSRLRASLQHLFVLDDDYWEGKNQISCLGHLHMHYTKELRVLDSVFRHWRESGVGEEIRKYCQPRGVPQIPEHPDVFDRYNYAAQLRYLNDSHFVELLRTTKYEVTRFRNISRKLHLNHLRETHREAVKTILAWQEFVNGIGMDSVMTAADAVWARISNEPCRLRGDETCFHKQNPEEEQDHECWFRGSGPRLQNVSEDFFKDWIKDMSTAVLTLPS